MCSRYQLVTDWRNDAEMRTLGVPQAPGVLQPPGERIDCARSTWHPIVRNDDLDALHVDDRRWGFHRHYADVDHRDQTVKRELFVADSAQVARLPSFKLRFALGRCLIPMSSWSEWQVIDHKQTLVEVSIPKRSVFAVAGLYETSHDIRTGVLVDTFIVLTAKPNAFFGSAKRPVPLVLEADDCLAWLNDREEAHRLARSSSRLEAVSMQPFKPSGLGEFVGGGPARPALPA